MHENIFTQESKKAKEIVIVKGQHAAKHYNDRFIKTIRYLSFKCLLMQITSNINGLLGK